MKGVTDGKVRKLTVSDSGGLVWYAKSRSLPLRHSGLRSSQG